MALTSELSAAACLTPDELVIAKHQSKIDKVVTEIHDTIAQEDYLENGSRYSGILQAKQEQLEELENQLRAYKMVMGRTVDPQQGNRESYRFSGRLPAFGKRIEIDGFVDHFDSLNRFLIVQGQTGSGKSTQLPQYIADHPRMSGKKIICTQPRKIAATSLADRVAFEYACGKKSRVGPEVGYSVGGSRSMVEEKTKIIFMTEGRMLERVINRRESDFKNVGAIIIDEAHERSITCDILLGVLKKADPLWKDILLVVASATIDLAVFEKFFDHRATVIEIAGRMYPVQRLYKPLSEGGCILSEQDEIVKAVGQIAMEIHTSKNTKRGDILCFLPSAEEVHRTADWFEKNLKKNKEFVTAKIYELSGRQDADEQRNVFEKLDPKKYRKIIFASPIAETSITINGVVYVVDSGVKKEMSFDPKRNISSLKIVDISQSSSLQREGRAGRTQPGVCYKLYTEEDFRNMSVNSLPEIFRRPLPLSILFLRKMGVDPVGFDWVSSPEPEAIRKAETELILLGAIDADNKKPTALGELISHSQQDPKIVRMIYNGMLKGYGMVAIKLAALLSVSSYFFFNGGKEADVETKAHHFEKRRSLQHEDGDILTLLRVYTAYESLGHVQVDSKEKKRIKIDWIKDNSLRGKAIRTAESTVSDLKYIFCNTAEWRKRISQDLFPTEEEVLRLFCSGYFLHAARRVNVKVYGRNRLSYFAIEPEVVGSLPYSASLKQTSNDGDNEIPEWIIFDQILKFSEKTIFPGSSRIDFSWIQQESNEFYLTCNLKERKLPTEVVEIEAADTVLRTIFGKRLINLPRLEDKLGCSIIADLSDGFLRGLCTRTSRLAVENSLREEVGRAKEVLKRETMEFTWRGNTRLVIASGYEVLSILFPREFNTICIYNLHQDSTLQELEQTVYLKIDDRQKISGIRFFRLERSCMGIIKLFNPSDAALLLNELKEETNDEGGISVTPHMGDDSTGTIPKGEEVKLKISWPLGYSTGEATVIVETAQDGNKIVDRISNYFHDAYANAFGDIHLTDFACQKPRCIKLRGRPYRFCEDTVYEVEPTYKVKIKKLFSWIDEFQIIEQLKRFNVTPLRVFVHRKDSPREEKKNKEENLSPFRSSRIGSDEEVTITDFLDKAACRGGVFVYHPDKSTVENVYHDLEEKYRRVIAFNQPYRVELDRTFTFSVHMDLYRCLRPKFKGTLSCIRKLNVFVIETGPGTGSRKNQDIEKKMTFVYITLRHSDASVIRRCRQMLEAILEKESLTPETSPNIENLFTWSGRVLLKERIPTSHDHCIHWDNWNRSVYVYGMEPETRNEIIAKLNSLIDLVETWKKAGFFEEAVNLDRRALEDLEKTNPNFIDSLCKTLEIERGQYHLIGRSKLLISAASTEEFENFQKALDAKGLRFSGERKKPAVGRDCVVCFCEVDSDFKITSICSHAFCVGCIQNMFTGAAGVQKLPLCCPADQCELRLPVQDVMKILPARFKSKLNESALDVYLRSEKGSGVRYCPKPGCNQIFRPNKPREGPTFYGCDNCLADFCLECTEALGKEVGAHPGQSCDSVRLGEDDKVWKNMNRIRDEILNLRCPKCKAAFYDYDGCAALTCSNCRAAICAICLEYCGSDAHRHVATCRYNQSGSYYLNPDSNTVKKGNRQYRIDKLKEFFRITPGLDDPPDLKTKILTALANDLKDLDIQLTDVMPL